HFNRTLDRGRHVHRDQGAQGRRDRVAAVLMYLAAVGAFVAFIGAIPAVRDADSATVLVESWRMLGFLVFAGLFALLAARPRHYAGVWELAFLHKAGMAVTALLLLDGDAEGAGSIASIDGALAVMILLAYVLARGHTAWRNEPAPGIE